MVKALWSMKIYVFLGYGFVHVYKESITRTHQGELRGPNGFDHVTKSLGCVVHSIWGLIALLVSSFSSNCSSGRKTILVFFLKFIYFFIS
jgi:hypothetical protein